MLLMLLTKPAILLQYLRIFIPLRNRSFYLAWLFTDVNFADFRLRILVYSTWKDLDAISAWKLHQCWRGVIDNCLE